MKSLLLYSLLAATAPVALAQAPVEDARVNQNTLLQAQQKRVRRIVICGRLNSRRNGPNRISAGRRRLQISAKARR